MELHLNKPLVFIDLETTGVETLKDRIVELSALKINPDNTEESITARINPQMPIPPEAIAVHGIKEEDVKDKPSFKEYAQTIKNFLEDCDLAGFNIKKFDLEILEAEFKRANVEFSKEDKFILDVQTIYHKFDPRNLSAAYKKYCNKEIEKAHNSEHDVRATWDIFRAQLEMHKELPNNIRELHNFCNERKSASWIDSKGKFIWIGNDVVLNFSSHKGKLLSYMVKNETSFLNWMLAGDFLPDAKKIVSDALNGNLPKK
ncbi:MAG: 3'-5' exonuclease [Nanoarchaeota archaeon]